MPSLKRTNDATATIAAKRARKQVISDISTSVQNAQHANPISSGALGILNEAKLIYPWLTKNMVYGHIRRCKAKAKKNAILISNRLEAAETSTVTIPNIIREGRLKESTIESNLTEEAKKIKAKDNIAILYQQAKDKNKFGRLRRNGYKMIHDFVIDDLGITDNNFSVSAKCIQSRIYRNALTVDSNKNQHSPKVPIHSNKSNCTLTTQRNIMSNNTHANKVNLTSGQDLATLNSDVDNNNVEPSTGDIRIAKLGRPVHTSCCPSGTVEFLSDKDGVVYEEGCCDAVSATVSTLTTRMSTHAPKFLLLTGSLRSVSCSRRVAIEVGRILAGYGAEVKLFDATDLPLFSQDINPKSNPKVTELRDLTRWCEGMVWISPEVHGNYSAVFKNQVDWMPLTEGAIKPTQGKTVAVMQVEAGSQSFNTVNNLRVLGRWLHMTVIPNQASMPQAYKDFNEADGTMKEGPFRSRVVNVVDELFRYTLLLRDQQPFLLQRYSEKQAQAKRHLHETSSHV